MLKFKTDTWHFKAYSFWHCKVKESYVPTRTNLCSYTYGVMLGCLAWSISRFFIGLAFCLYLCSWPLLAMVGLLCGWLPFKFDWDEWKSYKPFLTMFGEPIHLMQLVAPTVTACLLMLFVTILPVGEHFILQGLIFFTIGSIPVLLAVLLMKLATVAIKDYKKTHVEIQLKKEENLEDPNLFIEMLRAKKQKICPIVEFHYNNSKDDNDDR